VVSYRWAFAIPFAQSTNGVVQWWRWCARSGIMVSHFQNDADGMVQNKSRLECCMKPYVRSIPSAMGVESEVEAMDNAQERLCHWSHVLCTSDIEWTLLFTDADELRQRCHILQTFVDSGWHKAQHIQRCMHCNGFAYNWQWMASSLGRSRSLGLRTIVAWHVCLHADVLWGDKSQIAIGCTLGIFEWWHWGNDTLRAWWSNHHPFWGCAERSCIVWHQVFIHDEHRLEEFSNASQV